MSQSQPELADHPHRPRFRQTALASGLLDEAQIAAAEREVNDAAFGLGGEPEAHDRAVADTLVARGLLTPFQAREMLAGRRRFKLGQYTVLDEIGKGGMGRVFQAEHAMMGRLVAVKVLPREKSTPESEAAFRREMRMLGRLDHENLVRAFDAGFDAQVYYLVTELVPGVDLSKYVREHGPLDETAAAWVIAQAARGLAHAHDQGLVHRDVKPGNIVVLRDLRVKVLDLGLAGSQAADEAVRVDRVFGTPDYMAPEQTQSPDDVGPAADIYSLGCTLYFTVTGQVPFPGGTRREKMHKHLHAVPRPAQELVPDLSERFCRVIEDMMAKAPADRIATAAEVIARLEPWLKRGRRRPRAVVRAESPAAAPVAATAAPSSPSREDSASFWDHLVPPSTAVSPGVFSRILPPRAARRRLMRRAGWACVIAAAIGLVVGLAATLYRNADEQQFQERLLGVPPLVLGCGAFVVGFIVQMLVAGGGRR